MFTPENSELPTIQLHNAGLYKASKAKTYVDIVSPFTRMYLISRGSGSLVIGSETIYLEEGYIYLIPSYTFCTYHFGEDMCQYYLHFTTQLPGELNVFDLYAYRHRVKAHTFDVYMLQKLLVLHPDCALASEDPNIYQKKDWMQRKVRYQTVSHFMETRGIIEQLLARFLVEEKGKFHRQRLVQYNLKHIFIYIENHLQNEIPIAELATMACLSKDHFTRIFKSATGYPPSEYIVRKRVEKAQCLLLTTPYSQNKIIEETGFRSLTYFSRVFKKYTAVSPGKYRKQV